MMNEGMKQKLIDKILEFFETAEMGDEEKPEGGVKVVSVEADPKMDEKEDMLEKMSGAKKMMEC